MSDIAIERYTQGFEQDAIIEAVKGIPRGRFLEIGAWNPRTFSNTRALYEMGWSGVMVEPSPEPFLSLLREYGNDERIKLVLAAIGDGRLTKFMASADGVSTSVVEHYEKWKQIGGYFGSFFIPTLGIPDLMREFGTDFDMVSIDAEGNSAQIAKDLFARSIAPQCVIVEHDGQANEEGTGDLDIIAAGRGYRRVPIWIPGENRKSFVNGENVVYAR